jgi:hypothetical protein
MMLVKKRVVCDLVLLRMRSSAPCHHVVGQPGENVAAMPDQTEA